MIDPARLAAAGFGVLVGAELRRARALAQSVSDHHPVSWGIPCRVCGWREWKAPRPGRPFEPALVAIVTRYDFDPRCEGWWCFRCLERLGRDVPPSAIIVAGEGLEELGIEANARARRLRARQVAP